MAMFGLKYFVDILCIRRYTYILMSLKVNSIIQIDSHVTNGNVKLILLFNKWLLWLNFQWNSLNKI